MIISNLFFYYKLSSNSYLIFCLENVIPFLLLLEKKHFMSIPHLNHGHVSKSSFLVMSIPSTDA